MGKIIDSLSFWVGDTRHPKSIPLLGIDVGNLLVINVCRMQPDLARVFRPLTDNLG